METLVYGGTFDPPTKAHEAIIAACLEQPNTAEVWVMPSGLRADKTGMQADETRLAMLGALKQGTFNNNEKLIISSFELTLPRPTQTARTVAALEAAYPERQFRFVFGADSYCTMKEWHDGAQLQGRLAMLLVGRDGLELPPPSHRLQSLTPPPLPDVSSTMVRQLLAEGQPVDAYVPAAIAAFIAADRLYAEVQ